MKIQINTIRIPVNIAKERLKPLVLKKFHLNESDIADFRILRWSVDARKKADVVSNFKVMLELKHEMPELLALPEVSLWQEPEPMEYQEWTHPCRPVVVGFGPAGMFAALYLARCHARPIVIERGERVEERKKSVERFLKEKILNPDSNIQFGEGGAGTFSDGKLTTNLHNELIGFVLEEFYQHGAPEDVLYAHQPHVGTDYLEIVVRNIREEILSLGGEILFNTTFTDFRRQKDGSLTVICGSGAELNTQYLLLGLGHSARDTLRHLHGAGLKMEPKSFSVGVRVEHLQSAVNTMQYGKFASYLPPASYKGAVHVKQRGAYTFCMCPGGTVMASASEEGAIVTNGMSEKSRNKENANSALLVGIEPSDFYQSSPLDGLDFQEQLERKAFSISGDHRAPANLMREFLQGRVASRERSIHPSYPHGVVFCDLRCCLPDYVVETLQEAIPLLDRKLRGFAHADAVLTGVETRSSSPVRILRGEDRQSNVTGIYPIGEGAGYAGGITSSAIDGLRTAIHIVQLNNQTHQHNG
ncbi:MAG: FAD-binding protein [Bacteroidales bacterium]|nr:FAD-binding protein [Bacteroidales bacterium]